jgi:pyruvate dehydrogenase E2 component (dihydrolipoamide acetyltransferase)
MVLFAVSRVILNHKDLNAHWLDDVMRIFDNVNLGIAVDTERGLMVPTLMAAETMTLNELSANAKALIKETQSGSISPDKLSGGTFTVTNLGSLGVESFTPVINPPQVAILGVCAITQRIKADGSVYPAMGLSLTFDHRALDGAPAAKFMKALCDNLANFNLLLAK